MPIGRIFVLTVTLLIGVPAAAWAAPDKPVTFDAWALPGASVGIDPAGTSTLQDALDGKVAFGPAASIAWPGRASSLHPLVIWLRIPVPGALAAGSGAWFLEGSRYLGRAVVYARPRGDPAYSAADLGLRIPFAERAVARALPTARLPAPLAPGSDLYVRAAIDLEFLPLSIRNEASLQAEDAAANANQRLVLLLSGVFITLGLCNLLVFANTREAPYAFYSISMLILAAIGPMQSNALAWEILWPHASLSDMWTRFPALFVESYASLAFALSFLQTRRYAPRLANWVIAFLVLAPILDLNDVLLFPSVALPFGLFLADLQIFTTTLMWAGITLLGIVAIRHRVPGAWFAVIAFGVVFCASSVYLLTTYFWNDLARQWTYLLLLGARLFEGFVLFWALADRLQRTTLAHISEQRERLIAQAEALGATQRLLLETKKATTDALTGIANRRVFDDALLSEWKRAQRDGTSLAIVMIDVDHFKRFNDAYGHIAGDGCLQAVASAIAATAKRPNDVSARYGGEEFAVVLPGTEIEGALAIAEEIRENVARLRIEHSGSESGFVSISVGVAASTAQGPDAANLVAAADRSLYAAKQGGRNRVAAATA